MPYEATVPVHRRLLWPAVTDPERLLGALPNVSIDASGAQGVAGRLRVRTREQTITFRGVARIVEVVPTSLRVSLEVEAVFGRAGGSVEGVIEIALRQSGSGTRVVVGGRMDVAPGDGALPADTLDSALRRVVQRWFAALAESSPAGMAQRGDETSGQERAPLAVVRDVPADATAPSTVATPVPQPPDTSDADASVDSEPVEGAVKNTVMNTEIEPEPVAPAPLRLVASKRNAGARAESKFASESKAEAGSKAEAESAESEVGPRAESEDADEPKDTAADKGTESESAVREVAAPALGEDAVRRTGAAADEARLSTEPVPAADVTDDQFTGSSSDAALHEPDDIWSRLRDRSMPPWIPFLVGAATATLAALVLLFAALRRAARRR